MIQDHPLRSLTPSAEAGEAWAAPMPDALLEPLRALALPTSLRGFLLFLLGLGVVGCSLALQVILAADIHHARIELAALQADLDRVEERNADLVWQIAVVSRLDTVQERALALGYAAPGERRWVRPPPPPAAPAGTTVSRPPLQPAPAETRQRSPLRTLPVELRQTWSEAHRHLEEWRGTIGERLGGHQPPSTPPQP